MEQKETARLVKAALFCCNNAVGEGLKLLKILRLENLKHIFFLFLTVYIAVRFLDLSFQLDKILLDIFLVIG